MSENDGVDGFVRMNRNGFELPESQTERERG
jgi:hypothetical protein